DPEQRDYAERAREGVGRLQRLLRAMSEATRIEQIAAEATRLTVDLAPILETTVAGYADAWPERHFRLERTELSCPVVVAPELIVQLLDKFVDNAVSFSSPGDTINLTLRRAGGEARVTVTNPGPPLPAGLEARVFESLVSVRAGAPGRHLGFGLYIARLIAEAHDGTLRAGNTPDGGGVAFSLHLPLAAVTVTADAAGKLQ
ncbi:MAG: HAMP domain-containing sensor histidine kinase, partial [Pseudomonadota bacterium]